MDETSYSDSSIIDAINKHYIPVRVDNDRRPDVNARYNQGGWPTTAFLTPRGALLAGATYLPPEQMLEALGHISNFYRTNKEQIAQRAGELGTRVRHYDVAPSTSLNASIIALVAEQIEEAYDEEYGGFGDAPKFPMTDVLDFLLQEYRVTGSDRMYEMLARSMLGMSGGGMYDHVEGGFFRYSTTRDWSVPHFEKMTEDHAALLRILATLVRLTHNDSFRKTLLSALSYIRTVLRDPRTQLFAGSQDADEAYFELPLEERRGRQAPYVDRTSYSNWTAAMGATFIIAGTTLDNDRIVLEGEATLDALHERMLDANGLLTHFIEPGGSPQVHGLLTDQSAYLRALLDAHEYTGHARFLQRARDLATAIEAHFAAEDGGFFDHASMEDTLGNLPLRDRPLADNASLAESFMRLALLDNEPRYRDVAERALRIYANTYDRSGIFAAPYARAVRRYLSPETSVVLIGSVNETTDLREAAQVLPKTLLAVRTIGNGEEGELARRGFDADLHPAAYVCRGSACGAPAQTVAGLRDAYEQLVATA